MCAGTDRIHDGRLTGRRQRGYRERKRKPMAQNSKRGRGSRRRQGGNNNPNRSMDSQGPEVKIRGTAQQIYDKYTALARDAFSSGDRIRGESLQQHAEHYYRMLKAMQSQEKKDDRSQQDAKSDKSEASGNEARDDAAQNEGDSRSGKDEAENAKPREDPPAEASEDEAASKPRRPRRRRTRRDEEEEEGSSEPDEAKSKEREEAPAA